MADTDVIVCDEEIEFAAKKVDEYCNYLCNLIDEYCSCLDAVTEKAIIDNSIAVKLKHISSEIRSCKTEIGRIGQEVPGKCRQYVKDIDTVDSFLY